MVQEIHAMIFDFDGTLAEVHIDFTRLRKEAIRAAKAVTKTYAKTSPIPPLPEDDGRPALEWLELARQTLYDSHPEITHAMKRAAHNAITEVEIEAARKSVLFSWVRPLLTLLKEHGIAACIITRNCEQAVKTVFPDIDIYCTCLLTRDDVPSVKPDPDHLFQAVKIAGCLPAQAVMVGDHPMDIITGKAAGSLTAGVLSGHATYAMLQAEKPDFMAKNGLELYAILRKRYWPDAPQIVIG